MSTAISVYHGRFGRATLYRLNRRMTTHAHREGHLAFLVDGPDAAMTVCDRRHPISATRSVAVNPWEPHDFVPGIDPAGSLFLILYVKPLWFLEVGRCAQSALRFGRAEIVLTGPIRRSVRKVVSLLLAGGALDLFDGYLYELTQECFDQSWQWVPPGGAQSPPAVGDGVTLNDFRVRKSIRIMSENLGTEISLGAIAREAGLSRPHFYKLFRRQTGITPNLYLNTLRMERAIAWLTETGKSVTTIGYDLGFSSQSGFTRFFAVNVGMAPTDYRRVTQLLHA